LLLSVLRRAKRFVGLGLFSGASNLGRGKRRGNGSGFRAAGLRRRNFLKRGLVGSGDRQGGRRAGRSRGWGVKGRWRSAGVGDSLGSTVIFQSRGNGGAGDRRPVKGVCRPVFSGGMPSSTDGGSKKVSRKPREEIQDVDGQIIMFKDD